MNAPRWALALLRRLAPPGRAEDVLGDLEEAHRTRVGRHGRRIASVRSGLEAVDMATALLRGRIRRGRAAARQARSAVASSGGSRPEGGPEPERGLRPAGRLIRARVSLLDFKLGARMLAKHPMLTVVGGLAMAFAIALGAATFELVTQVVHPRLPLDEGDRVVGIRLWDAAGSDVAERATGDVAAWRGELESIEDLGAFRTVERNLVVGGAAGAAGEGVGEPVMAAEMSAAGFRVARVPPLLGRTLVEADEREGAAPVVVIGHDAWRARFAGDPGIVGRTVRLGGREHTVVGVMPEGFAFPVNHRFWVPLRRNVLDPERREGRWLRLFGRLAPGAGTEEARAELAAVVARVAADAPETSERVRTQVLPYAGSFAPVAPRQALGVGYSINMMVVLFLVLVCANVAILVFARTATRESEIVVRNALGASRGRIVAQLFAEMLVLGAVAAAIGLAAAEFGLRWGLGIWEAVEGELDLPFWVTAGLGLDTVVYAGLLTVLGAAVAGVVPALKVTRGVGARLREAGAGGATLRFGRMWTIAIVSQVAFTVALLPIIISVAVDTAEIEELAIGVPAEEYLTVRLEMDREIASGASADEARAAFRARFRATYAELERRLAAEPAVIAATFATRLPGGYHRRRLFEVEGVTLPPGSTIERQVQTAAVAVDFFDAMRAPILSGRGFRASDLAASDRRVVIVNGSFVDRFLAGRNAVGRRVRYAAREGEDDPGPWHEIVGVVEELTLTVDPDLPHNAGLYHPAAPGAASPMRVAVHLRGDPAAFAPRLRTLAAAVDPALRLHDLRPLDEIRWDLLTLYLFWLRVAAVAGALVLLLSTAGIYSIMSFAVSRRTREIGIRVALGADPRRIVAAIFSRAFAQLGLGVAVGAGLLVALMGGTPSAWGMALIAMGVAIMVAAGLVACIGPTRRALRIEPTEALAADG